MTHRRPAVARQFAEAALQRGDPTGWFERLYAAAARGEARVPWVELAPNPHLVSWAEQRPGPPPAGRALVVGCGLGDDAEFLAGLGYAVTAFDIAPTAITAARDRFPSSTVDYVVADVFAPPADWRSRYDLVVEAYTVQVYRDEPRQRVIRHIVDLVAEGGTLLVIAHARPIPGNPGPPWPLTRADVTSFARPDLRLVRLDEVFDDNPPGHRWRAEFRRTGGSRAGGSAAAAQSTREEADHRAAG